MKVKLTITFLLISILLVSFNINANAISTGFETETINEEQTEKVLNNLNFSAISSEKSFHSIPCFDISDDGLIAIGVDGNSDKYINIYDENGIFQYGYSFNTSGTFGVEFDNDNLIVYLVRSDLAVLIDREGKCLSIESISNTIDNNTYWNHSVFARVKEHNGDKYYRTNENLFLKIFSPSYSQLVKISPDGTKTIIFDKSLEYTVIIIVGIILIIIFFAILITQLVKLFKKSENIQASTKNN